MLTSEARARRNIEQRIYRDAAGLPPPPKWRSVLPMLTEHGFARRVIRKRLRLPTPLNTTDRIELEQRIFPRLAADMKVHDVLFVGCDNYTAHYERVFFSHANYITIEPDPAKARYGASRTHLIAPLEELGRHLACESLDLIVCNGVYGWGLDTASQLEAAFEQCHACLRADGLLLFGWDDIPRRCPVPLEQIAALGRFRHFTFAPLGTWRYVTDTPFRHTYGFYRK